MSFKSCHKSRANADTGGLLLVPNLGSGLQLTSSIGSGLQLASSVGSGLQLTPITPRRDLSRSRHASACSRRGSASARRGSSYSEYVSTFDRAFAEAIKSKDEKTKDDEADDGHSGVKYLIVYFILFFGVLLVDKRAVLKYFLRDELQYTDGFERQELFHNNDKLISVEDLWKAWKHSTVYNWTVDDVIEWLVQDVDLPQYSQVFHSFSIDGSSLPRLVNATSPLLTTLGIRNPVHKQKLSLKAMDTILFGAPKRLHNYAKDVMLFMAILLAIGISWFACLHHRYSQTQVKKMMKDLESLQKAEDALKKLSKELSDAEKSQVSMPADKQEELRILRQNSLRLKVPRINNGDKSPTHQGRDYSRRQEGEMKLKKAEEELASLREALTEAENRLEIQQQLESQWSVPGELQAWLQLTHELEQVHYNAKRQAAERQLLAARDGCDKIKRRNKAFFGSLRMAHSNSLDDVDQSILDARAALEEVKQDLQERLHRWHTIEILCGFPVISNPGLNTLKQALGRDMSSTSRVTGSLLAPVSIEEADEDIPPADENRDSDSLYFQIPERPRQQIFAWARRSRHNYWMKKKTNDESKDSESLYNQIPASQRPRIFAWAHRGRVNSSKKKKTMDNGYTAAGLPTTTKTSSFYKQQTPSGSTGSLPQLAKVASPAGSGIGVVKSTSRESESQGSSAGNTPVPVTVGSSAASVIFHLGDSSQHIRSHSSASLSFVGSNLTNGHHPGHGPAKNGHGIHALSHSASSTPITTPSLIASNSSNNLLPGKIISRANASSSKIYSSASGNHLTATAGAAVPMHVNGTSANSSPNNSEVADGAKLQINDFEDAINFTAASTDPGSCSSSTQDSLNTTINLSLQSNNNHHNHHEDSDSISMASAGPRSKSHSLLSRNHHDSSPESDLRSPGGAGTLHDARGRDMEVVERKKSEKKKNLIPKFLLKGKKKLKSS